MIDKKLDDSSPTYVRVIDIEQKLRSLGALFESLSKSECEFESENFRGISIMLEEWSEELNGISNDLQRDEMSRPRKGIKSKSKILAKRPAGSSIRVTP